MISVATNPNGATYQPPLKRPERAYLVEVGRIHTFNAGEPVLGKGRRFDGLYVVIKGKVAVASTRRSMATESRRLLGPGSSFGQDATSGNDPAPFLIRAVESTTLVHLDSVALARLLHEHLSFGSRLLFAQHDLFGEFARYVVDGPATGKVMAVYGPRGGAGATTVAVTAAALAGDLGVRTLLVDLHPWFGEVAALCEYRPKQDVLDVLSDELTTSLLAEVASSGRPFDILAAPRRLEDGEKVGAEHLRALLDLAVLQYELVILDLPEALTDVVLVGLEMADEVVLTLTADLEGLLAGRKLSKLLARFDIPVDRVRVLLNRYRGSGGLSPDPLGDALPYRAVLLSEDAGQLLKLANDGLTWSAPSALPEHPLVKACRDLVYEAVGLAASEAQHAFEVDDQHHLPYKSGANAVPRAAQGVVAWLVSLTGGLFGGA